MNTKNKNTEVGADAEVDSSALLAKYPIGSAHELFGKTVHVHRIVEEFKGKAVPFVGWLNASPAEVHVSWWDGGNLRTRELKGEEISLLS